MINIEFEYGINSEIQRVKNTLSDLEWLNKNKYRYSLPIFDVEPDRASEKNIQDSVKKEYSDVEFKIAEKAVSLSWEKRRPNVEKIQDNIIGVNKLDQVKIIFTKYGTGGSYRVPGTIVTNLKDKIPEYLIKTVIHESIHLMIENLIAKNKVAHWYKERIVDLIMDKEFESAFK